MQTTVHMERKLTLRRQGLVQGRHAPLPQGLPGGPPPLPPPEAAGTLPLADTAPSVAGAIGMVASAAAAAVSSFTDGAAPRKASFGVITSESKLGVAGGSEPAAGSGGAPSPDAEVVRRVLSEHGARVRAEALGEAQAEAAP